MATTWQAQTLTTSFYDAMLPGTMGFLGIYNNSNYTIDIIDITVNLASPARLFVAGGSLVGTNTYQLRLIDSVPTGGTSESVIKLDTDSADLPDEVLILNKPDVASSSLLRQIPNNPGIQPTLNGLTTNSMIGGKINTAEFINTKDVQKIALNEGQGISIFEETSPFPHMQNAEIGFTVRSTGASYVVMITDLSTREGPLCAFALYNGTGSGVVLDVNYVNVYDIGGINTGTTLIGGVRIGNINSFIDGVDITPSAFDSNSTFPSGITVRKNFSMNPYNCNGTTQVIDTLYNTVSPNITSVEGVRSVAYSVFSTGMYRYLMKWPHEKGNLLRELDVAGNILHTNSTTRIKLRRGDGIGIGYDGIPSTTGFGNTALLNLFSNVMNNYNVGITFNIVEPLSTEGIDPGAFAQQWVA